MKSIIKHKQIYYIILTLHVFFLAMPVSHAGEIVLCYRDAGQIEIELKLSQECSSCNKSSDDSQEKDPCFCVDIPISKETDEHSTLVSSRTIQAKPLICLQPNTTKLVNPTSHDDLFILASYPHLKSTIHESLCTTVLLI
jgi:hypothetical protein